MFKQNMTIMAIGALIAVILLGILFVHKLGCTAKKYEWQAKRVVVTELIAIISDKAFSKEENGQSVDIVAIWKELRFTDRYFVRFIKKHDIYLAPTDVWLNSLKKIDTPLLIIREKEKDNWFVFTSWGGHLDKSFREKEIQDQSKSGIDFSRFVLVEPIFN